MLGETMVKADGELKVSFGYQCSGKRGGSSEVSDGYEALSGIRIHRSNNSFSCLNGAALSANATFANTDICNGLIGAGILPGLDSPKSFRRVPSSPSFARSDLLLSSYQSGMSNLSCSPSTPPEPLDWDSYALRPMSAPSRSEGFLNVKGFLIQLNRRWFGMCRYLFSN